jgi:hypothetical protein
MAPTVAVCTGLQDILAILSPCARKAADRVAAVIPSLQEAGASSNSQFGLQLGLGFTPILFIPIG